MPVAIATQVREEEVLIVTQCPLGVILPTLQIRELRLRAGKIIQLSNQNQGATSDLGFLWLNIILFLLHRTTVHTPFPSQCPGNHCLRDHTPS